MRYPRTGLQHDGPGHRRRRLYRKPHLAKRGVAALTVCVVRALNESDPTFQERFLEWLGKAYSAFHKMKDDMIQELELLAWTREYLTDGVRSQDKENRFCKTEVSWRKHGSA